MHSAQYGHAWGEYPEAVEVMMWTDLGECLGPVAGLREVRAEVDVLAISTMTLTAEAVDQNAPLLRTDGAILLTAAPTGTTDHDDFRWEGIIAASTIRADDDAPATGVIEVTAAGPATLMSEQALLGWPSRVITDQGPLSEWTFTGDAPYHTYDVITRAAMIDDLPVSHDYWGSWATGSRSRAITYKQGGAAHEALETILDGERLYLDWRIWFPGDPPPWEGWASDAPRAVCELKAWSPRSGLRWGVDAGDVLDWEVGHTRRRITRVIVREEVEGGAKHHAVDLGGATPRPWERRTILVDAKEGDDIRAIATDTFLKYDATSKTTITLTPSAAWRPGRSGKRGRYWPGDVVDIDIPLLGTVERAITAVEMSWKIGDGIEMKPTLHEVDTLSTRPNEQDAHTRLGKIERAIAHQRRESWR